MTPEIAKDIEFLKSCGFKSDDIGPFINSWNLNCIWAKPLMDQWVICFIVNSYTVGIPVKVSFGQLEEKLVGAINDMQLSCVNIANGHIDHLGYIVKALKEGEQLIYSLKEEEEEEVSGIVHKTKDILVYISYREDITELIAPNATIVNCYGCTKLTKLELPLATIVNCYGCPKLTKLELPLATTVDCNCCTQLTKLELPLATTVYCHGCTQLTKLELPLATTVYCMGCTQLTKLELPLATHVFCNCCTKLNSKWKEK